MSIVARIDDARFLLSHGRYEGALLCALVAVEATARKRFPKNVALSWKPLTGKQLKPRTMGDGEAFRNFLRAELPTYAPLGPESKVRIGQLSEPLPDAPNLELPTSPDAGASDAEYDEFTQALSAAVEGFSRNLTEYPAEMEAYCERISEQMWPLDKVFWKLCRCGLCHNAQLPDTIAIDETTRLYIRCDEECLHLSVSWVAILISVVEDADENAGLFGRPNESADHDS